MYASNSSLWNQDCTLTHIWIMHYVLMIAVLWAALLHCIKDMHAAASPISISISYLTKSISILYHTIYVFISNSPISISTLYPTMWPYPYQSPASHLTYIHKVNCKSWFSWFVVRPCLVYSMSSVKPVPETNQPNYGHMKWHFSSSAAYAIYLLVSAWQINIFEKGVISK